MEFNAEYMIRFLEMVAARVKAHRDELTQLDAAIGDADHGANLDRGFSAVLAKLPDVADKDVGTILKTAGMTLVSTVGGASGPLYGTAYMRAGMALANRQELGRADLAVALQAALEGIMARGKAQRGEKTMIDTIAPCLDVLHASNAEGDDHTATLRHALAAAKDGMHSTSAMLATKGRASYLGERSIGHQDPGATSAFYMLQALFEVIQADSAGA